MKAFAPLLVLILLSGCHAYRTPIPEGCCLVTFTRVGYMGRRVKTDVYGVREGDYVRVSAGVYDDSFVEFITAVEPGKWDAVLDAEKLIEKDDYILIPIYHKREFVKGVQHEHSS